MVHILLIERCSIAVRQPSEVSEMDVAITGVSGFLGSSLARLLIDDPRVDSILGLDVRRPSIHHSKLKYQRADLRDADFSRLFQGIDVVYHLAFVVEPPRGLSRDDIDEINIQGSERVFHGALEARVPKIVYSSSIVAYGAHPDNPENLEESATLRPNPDWYYSRTKGKVEKLLDEIEKKHRDTIFIRFRPCVILGESDKNPFNFLRTAPILLCPDPALRINFCWDEDVVEALRLALDYDQSGIFNLSGSGSLSIAEATSLIRLPLVRVQHDRLVFLAKSAAFLRLHPETQVDWYRSMFLGPLTISNERAIKLLGWKPRYDSRASLLAFVKDRRPLSRFLQPIRGLKRLKASDS